MLIKKNLLVHIHTGVDNSAAKERIEELRKRTSMSFSVRRDRKKEGDDD